MDDPLVALDEVVATGLAIVVDRPGLRELAVAHPLVRAAIVEDLAPSRLAGLHRAAGRALPGAAGLAHRMAGTVGHDGALAAEARTTAAAEAAGGAHAAAARLLLEARGIEPDADLADRDLLTAVDHQLLAGEPGAAGFRDRWRPCRRAPVATSCSATCATSPAPGGRRGPTSSGPGRRSASRVGPTSRRWPAGSPGCWRRSPWIAPTQTPHSTWVRHARRLAPQWAGEASQGHMLAMSHALRGRLAEGIDELTVELARLEGGAKDDAARVDLSLGRGVLRMWAGDLGGAADDLAACLVGGAGGTLVARETARYSLAELHYRAGRWDAAVVAAEVAAAIADAADQAWIAAFPHAVAVFPLAGRGEWARAEDHLLAATAATERAGGGAARLWIALAAARLAESRDDPEGVVAVCDRLAAGPRCGAPTRASSAGGRPTPRRSPRSGGSRTRPRSWRGSRTTSGRRRAPPPARTWPAPGWRWRWPRAMSRAPRRPPSAPSRSPTSRRPRSPVAAWSSWPGPCGGGRARSTGPWRRWRRPAVGFDRLGAAPWRGRVEGELARAGRRPARRPPVATPLTPQEWAVAHVVAAGRSNRETAAELFISVKTVEHHLSRAYAKLGVRSRTELAAPSPHPACPPDGRRAASGHPGRAIRGPPDATVTGRTARWSRVRVLVEMRRDGGGRVIGVVTPDGGAPRCFTGWLELIHLLEAHTDSDDEPRGADG